MTEKEKQEIVKLIEAGELQSRIAARYDVNQGRISEIKTGKTSGQFSLNI
ncbi:MAG: hypothetical protein JNM12_09910 [Alphaproteobacteria bacterium]|nr:hypothetical protein [Alphaproteobacteria bacterium]